MKVREHTGDRTCISSKAKEPTRTSNDWNATKKTTQLKTTSSNQMFPLRTLSAECDALGCITIDTCDLNAVAGAVLRHAISVLEKLFKREEPLTFKVGFTHNPIWRWTNDIYGYRYAKEKWSNMIILHFAFEPYSPAMLEAALIEKYQRNFAEIH